MTGRILTGVRSAGRTGLYVSKPGADVLTCADRDLLLDTDAKAHQVVHDETLSWASVEHGGRQALRWVSHPSLGYVPLKQIDILAGVYLSGRYPYSPIWITPFDATASGFYVWWDSTGYTGHYQTIPVTFRFRLYNVVDQAPLASPYISPDIV